MKFYIKMHSKKLISEILEILLIFLRQYCAFANISCGMHGKSVCGTCYCITHSDVNRGAHIRTCGCGVIKKNDVVGNPEKSVIGPGIEDTLQL